MEEFKFNLDPEKFKKSVQAKLEEETREISEDIPDVQSSDETNTANDDEIQNDDIVVFDDEDIKEDVVESEEEKKLKQQEKALKKLQKAQEKERRKQEKAEKKKHKGNNILFYIAFALLFVIISVALSLTVLFNIESVEVQNSTIYTADEIITASGVKLGDNIFLVSSDTLRNNICTKLPYIKNVTVEKGLNNKIVFNIEETYDYMVVDSNAGFAVLSPEKKVLRFIQGSYPNHLIHVFGLKINNVNIGETAEFLQTNAEKVVNELIPLLISTEFDKVKSISVFDMSAIKFIYDDRICVNIGTNTDLEYKLSFAKQSIESSLDGDAQGVLNLAQLSSKNREIQFRKGSLYAPKHIKDDPISE